MPNDKREIEGYVVVKHNRFDKVDNKRDVTLNCQFLDSERNVVVSDNLNFSKMNPEQYIKLKRMLGVDDLNSFTPMFIKLYRPEGDKIDEWEKLTDSHAEEPTGEQQTLEEDEEKKDEPEE